MMSRVHPLTLFDFDRFDMTGAEQGEITRVRQISLSYIAGDSGRADDDPELMVDVRLSGPVDH